MRCLIIQIIIKYSQAAEDRQLDHGDEEKEAKVGGGSNSPDELDPVGGAI